jgi:hypothetical protein
MVVLLNAIHVSGIFRQYSTGIFPNNAGIFVGQEGETRPFCFDIAEFLHNNSVVYVRYVN